jgi:ATP-binding cassette subfamily F protein 3
MINIKQISKSYGSLTVLSDISLSLGNGCKAALVGPNGVGKSTLLKIIAGLEESDTGEIEIPKNACIGYVPQEMQITRTETIENYFKEVAGIQEIERQINLLEKHLDDPLKAEQYNDLQQIYARLDGYAFRHRIESVLAGFKLENLSLSQSLSSLSSGQKSKIALGAILLKGVDILLLDEPTNNLDLPALIWLEKFLLNSITTCLIVSHDKRFLDSVVSRVFEIDWNTRKISVHVGGYSDYIEFKKKQINRLKELYRIQEEKIEKLGEAIRSKKTWAEAGARQTVSDKDKYCRGMRRDRAAKSAKSAKAIEKRIEQMDLIEVPEERPPLVIPLVAQKSEAKHSILLENVVAGYDENFRIGPISLEIPYGARVGIFGINGAGKSTLLKTITGELKIKQGTVTIGSSLIIGNLMQEHENLPRNKTTFQFLKERARLEAQQIYHLLSRFHFSAEESRKKISELSPGGRARLLLALFCALSANVLVLDEPTNHLDIEANEALEEVLSTYTGTVLMVSHDRYFLERVNLTHAFVLENGILRLISSYSEYVEEIVLNAKLLIKRLKPW